jgi:proteasome lid subunit RPN8/RPN11
MAEAPVALTGAARQAMHAAARAQFPEEACGVLLGRRSTGGVQINGLHRATNSAGCDRDLQFVLSPYDMHRASQCARAQGCDIVGFFHSHPRGRAQPSQQDWYECNPWPGYVHLIAALDEHSISDLTAWRHLPTGWSQDPIEDA